MDRDEFAGIDPSLVSNVLILGTPSCLFLFLVIIRFLDHDQSLQYYPLSPRVMAFSFTHIVRSTSGRMPIAQQNSLAIQLYISLCSALHGQGFDTSSYRRGRRPRKCSTSPFESEANGDVYDPAFSSSVAMLLSWLLLCSSIGGATASAGTFELNKNRGRLQSSHPHEYF